jgi:hypothetical protein
VFAVGIMVLAMAPERMDTFIRLAMALFPLFLAQVIPALIGSPLTDIMRAKAGAIAAAASASPAPATPPASTPEPATAAPETAQG